MRDCDYYPAGAYNDPNAPYNEVEYPAIEVECDVTVSLMKKVVIETDNYIADCDDYGEVCGYELQSSYAELADMVNEQHHSIPYLLDELAKYIKGELQGDISRSRRRHLERMLEECEGWETVETEVDDYEV